MADTTATRAPEQPAGYPREYERHLVLRDGREVLLRPIVPSDATELAAAIKHADPETLYRRFFTERPHITPALLTQLTTLDYIHRFALVAVEPATGRGVAVARFSEIEPGTADVAIAVDPAWRRVGLATALIETLAQAALERGIHTFTAQYLAVNQPVAALCHLSDEGRQIIHEGVADYAVKLDHTQVSAALRALARNRTTPAGDAAARARPRGRRPQSP